MPVVILEPRAVELSTFAVVVSFIDDAGAAVAPNAGLTWRLVDGHGNVVNSRSAVAIASASTVTVVLHGADLAREIGTPDTGIRYLTFSGTYNSSLGVNLELREQVQFYLVDLMGVP